MNRKLLIIFVILIAVSFISVQLAEKDNTTLTNSTKPTITVSITPQRTFVKAVAGDLVDVVTVIPPGFSPANYEPTPQDAISLSKTNVYFSIGVPSEDVYILPTLKEHNRSLKVVELHKKVEDIYLPLYLDSTADNPVRDPHIWLSPLRVKIMIQAISDELCVIDPKNTNIYQENASNYITKLNDLHKSILESLSSTVKRSFIVYHPVFGYFANDYNLEMISIETGGKEATATKLQKVVSLAKERDIKFIFYQDEFDDNQAKVIANEIGGSVIKTSPLSANYLDNMQLIADKIASALK